MCAADIQFSSGHDAGEQLGFHSPCAAPLKVGAGSGITTQARCKSVHSAPPCLLMRLSQAPHSVDGW